VRSVPIARIAFPALSGPRHVEFHPSGRWVFVVAERASSLYVLHADDGIPTAIAGTYSTVPVDYHGNNRPSEIQLHPNGRVLYVGNRGFDSITSFAVDDRGTVDTLGYQPGFGRSLSCVTVDPSGDHLIVGNVIPGNLMVFRLDDDGTPHPLGDPVETPAPRSLAFA
jgi:6-phosphogluconolactonase